MYSNSNTKVMTQSSQTSGQPKQKSEQRASLEAHLDNQRLAVIARVGRMGALTTSPVVINIVSDQDTVIRTRTYLIHHIAVGLDGIPYAQPQHASGAPELWVADNR